MEGRTVKRLPSIFADAADVAETDGLGYEEGVTGRHGIYVEGQGAK